MPEKPPRQQGSFVTGSKAGCRARRHCCALGKLSPSLAARWTRPVSEGPWYRHYFCSCPTHLPTGLRDSETRHTLFKVVMLSAGLTVGVGYERVRAAMCGCGVH